MNQFHALLLTLVAAAPGVDAASLDRVESRYCDYQLSGMITPGDAALLSDVQIGMGHWPGRMCLDSPGGSFAEAVRILEELWSRNIETVVAPSARCLSACAIVFMGGGSVMGTGSVRDTARILYPGADLGFHGPSLQLPDRNDHPSADVERAFELALEAIGRLYAWNQTIDDGIAAIPDFLMSLVLETPGDQMYHARTVADAALLDILIADVRTPLIAPEFLSEMSKNICAHLYVQQWQTFGSRVVTYNGEDTYLAALEPQIYRSQTSPDTFEPYFFAENLEVVSGQDRAGNYYRWLGDYPSQSKYVRVECLVKFPADVIGKRLSITNMSDELAYAAYGPIEASIQAFGDRRSHRTVTGKDFDNADQFDLRNIRLLFTLPYATPIAQLAR